METIYKKSDIPADAKMVRQNGDGTFSVYFDNDPEVIAFLAERATLQASLLDAEHNERVSRDIASEIPVHKQLNFLWETVEILAIPEADRTPAQLARLANIMSKLARLREIRGV